MLSQLRPAIALLAIMSLLTGLAYPLATTGIGQALFPRQAEASLITRDGTVVGSAFVGQAFTRPEYFHGRPSAVDYNAASSGGTNLAPTSRELIDTVGERARQIAAETGAGRVPVDLVTSSGSGLDPHISPESAYLQIRRVAEARGLPAAELRQMVDAQTDMPLFGIFGAPAVNVLKLNLALDERAPVKAGITGSMHGANAER
ncbi:potassium-transporting ATPase subunit KdpC [Nitratireductor sp. ZSWI3]|uniref:potassium-transporting ATPase subunit KdpC n=1 Tax=Nitratireductor sp. ZSWI3 TaxID=2966359 RepID=UPI00214F705C|nr:potassium-transporting ATPase subunit KdpC [Nitratireductor sp. ZSWI3]MCR4264713.1 potassium-transporting ATPase subunit KdpC [Nitratireductor sp. ZSWI3]